MMKRSESGFTLIELLMVMLLMVLVTTITVSGSFGMSRAASYTAAQDVVYNTFQTARQRACLDGKPVFVVLQDEETVLVVEGVGTVTGISSDKKSFFDRTATLDIAERSNGNSTKVTVWNLTTGSHAENVIASTGITDSESIPGLDESADYGYSHCKVTPRKGFVSSEWHIGDAYGFEVMPAKKVPKGFLLGIGAVGAKPNNSIVVFNADGSSGLGTKNASGITISKGDVNVFVYEKIAKDENKAVKISVKNGIVSVRAPKGN